MVWCNTAVAILLLLLCAVAALIILIPANKTYSLSAPIIAFHYKLFSATFLNSPNIQEINILQQSGEGGKHTGGDLDGNRPFLQV